MLLSVALNPVLDNDITILSLSPGRDITALRSVFRAGGKALNVAKISKVLGEEPCIVGFVAGASGALIRQSIIDAQISHHLIEVQGSSRICTNIIDVNELCTSIHQYGTYRVSPAELAVLADTFQSLLVRASCCVISGSLPFGVPDDIYARLTALCRSASVPCIVDVAATPLWPTTRMLPTVVKLNQTEAAEFTGIDVRSPDTAYRACKSLTEAGAEIAIVTLAEQGAVVYESVTMCGFHLIPPDVTLVSSVGCGDAFAAGLATAIIRGLDAPNRYAFAAGVATAVAMQELPDTVSVEIASRLAKAVTVDLL